MSRRVLVIEDSELGGRTLVTVLEAHGHQVRWELTADRADHIAAEWQPDAIIVDRNLPGVDGAALARELRTATGARVLVLSGDPAPASVDGVDAWLTKPVSGRQMLAALAIDEVAR